MGDLNVRLISNQKELNRFTNHLLSDIKALEIMLKDGWFPKKDVIHIGAEQEICLIDQHCKPAPKALEVLDLLNDDSFTTELAKFNIETNLQPRKFTDKCLSEIENEIHEKLQLLSHSAKEINVDYVITGILPTIRKFDMELENLTPLKRYDSLIKAINKLRGKIYELRIRGIDELNLKHDSAMLEACNTSFQVHLQVDANDFVRKYNIAQALAGPVLAISCNSPMLFGKRLWHETRVALFQQSIDTRITSEHLRERSARVTFGNKWLKNSILDLYKEDIMRFRVMLMTDVEEDVFQELKEGRTPKLKALNVHNSTVYRWNRPCYGISPNGKPHLRIENRILPSGPTPSDEVANAAFWLGLMEAFDQEYEDITELMDFDDANSNFFIAAYNGIDTKLKWTNDSYVETSKLVLDELLPIARIGLNNRKVAKEDIDKYLGIIQKRVESRQTGSAWMLKSFSKLIKETPREETAIAITSSMVRQQKANKPIHSWEVASMDDILDWHPSAILVEEFMTTDLFTVHKNDIIKLVAEIMDWQRLRYIPVEDEKGKLQGLITSRMLLRHFSSNPDDSITVKDLMLEEPVTISPDASIQEALSTMKKRNIGCLPVCKNGKLIGIVTESNFLNITDTLLNVIRNS